MVKTNSLGLRGPEVSSKKTKLVKRIVAIGDSIIDGYGVDNNATFSHYLQIFLNSKCTGRFEVLNVARGEGSIDKELAILKDVALPLGLDIVLLAFCTNDISDIRGRNKKELLNGKTGFIISEVGLKRRLLSWLITKTAIGEEAYKFYLENFRKTNFYKIKKHGESRYTIEGGDSFSENVRIFNAISRYTDGAVLNEPFSAEADLLISNYIFTLGVFKKICQNNNIELVFIYFPSYSQVYDLTISMRIRDILLQACQELSIPFLDLTPAFRKEGKNKVLHLAPLDFHLNPEGNKLMAETAAGFLISEKIIEW